MKTAKEMLNKIKWDEQEDPNAYTVGYKHDDEIVEIKFTDIKRFEDEFMIIGETNIPFHRIKIIKKNGEVVWQRSSAD